MQANEKKTLRELKTHHASVHIILSFIIPFLFTEKNCNRKAHGNP
jgi:hypothetical protein